MLRPGLCLARGTRGRLDRGDRVGRGGVDAPTCGECLSTVAVGSGACAAKLDSCFDDEACEKQLACLDACTDTEAACDAACGPFSAALTSYRACADELCGAACTPTCGFSFDHGACSACLQKDCCAAYTACAKDSVCRACSAGVGTDAACGQNAALARVAECYESKCEQACTPDSGELAPPPAPSSSATGGAGGDTEKRGRKTTIPTEDGACALAWPTGRRDGAPVVLLAGAVLARARRRRHVE